MSKDELLEKTCDLTVIANQIGILERLLGNIEYARLTGDNFLLHHQINSGVLNDIEDSLSAIKKDIEDVSNQICPDWGVSDDE
ncbi:hypothetical protein ACQKTA_09015 [Enterococcus sp. 22-H-5-01]|uniref:hypothetical protein n=1 Tax=Enterococcus sp. 22-H-5-01 TaxID=3418555 RepID=UPI003D06AC8C